MNDSTCDVPDSNSTGYIETLYEAYLVNRTHVSSAWQQYFDTLPHSFADHAYPVSHAAIQRQYREVAQHKTPQVVNIQADSFNHAKQVAVLQLINAYRFLGHRQAALDPLKQYTRPHPPDLDPAHHGLSDADLDTVFNTGSLHAGDELPLREILDIIQTTYCRSIGVEYMHINETAVKRWLQQRLESHHGQVSFSHTQKVRILERIVAATVFEEYLHTRYPGQKRFSLEGGESLIPLLDTLIETASAAGVKEMVIGMGHRGRLNVLVNTLGKNPAELCEEFEGKDTKSMSSGDVKYHLGYSSNIETSSGVIRLVLAFNPSHLEIVGPVVEGSARARQDRRKDHARAEVLPVLLHGDAAFSGQGVVMETLNLSQTRGYSTGGTVHIIINNQIGFTTSDPLDSRSTLYCTDVVKMIQAPIFHVNGDDPEVVAFVTNLALDYRAEFNRDVVIDLVCFRKNGHSETDEPEVTQPIMYQHVHQHPGVRYLYTEQLIKEDVITETEAEKLASDYIDLLDKNEKVSGKHADVADAQFLADYTSYIGTHWDSEADTTVDRETITRLAAKITTVPAQYTLHKSVARIMRNRVKMAQGEILADWGFTEAMAYASLLEAGYAVRVSGQDSGRGTFFHRHAVIHNQTNGDTWLPLQHVSDKQADFLVINSVLSEEAVLAFEYGYSSSTPETLVVWEAQFGDFANVAQVVFDQFISSCEAKWGRYCGLAVLLPHGFEGQGPEHSSARLERFLQLCAGENMQVCVPTTAAQMFHLLRRQILRLYRKPLIVMSPKSLLRRKLACSPLTALTDGKFQLVIDEIDNLEAVAVTRLLLCTGKVYYDLLEARREQQIRNIAIARIEQLFPFPHDEVKAMIARYPNCEEVVWVQEEPKNQGSWYYLQSRGTLVGCLGAQHTLGYCGRFIRRRPRRVIW